MRGDFSVVEATPGFFGETDKGDGTFFLTYLLESLPKSLGEI
jgi:hypothetical protein